jgi:hypothetical protein
MYGPCVRRWNNRYVVTAYVHSITFAGASFRITHRFIRNIVVVFPIQVRRAVRYVPPVTRRNTRRTRAAMAVIRNRTWRRTSRNRKATLNARVPVTVNVETRSSGLDSGPCLRFVRSGATTFCRPSSPKPKTSVSNYSLISHSRFVLPISVHYSTIFVINIESETKT